MQVKDIYENALALNIAKTADDEELEFFGIKLFNILLSETKAYNDCIRIKKGMKQLEKAPTIISLEDEMPYETELYAPFSYGLASKLLAAQEEMTLASLYHNQYITLLDMATPYVPVEVC
ncbi:MAG: hypothetical protein E7488_04020 [Ruminococcaceae bacterium]|nr:hypothetical protein [Oscillospiraceae bacterium]